MNEYCDNHRLNNLIEIFIKRGTFHEQVYDEASGKYVSHARSLDILRTPTGAYNKCTALVEEFNGFLRQNDIDAKQPLDSQGYPSPADPDLLGYDDRTISGAAAHMLTVVRLDDSIYSIDWTAAQYGYHEFPLVQCFVEGHWQRLNKEVRAA